MTVGERLVLAAARAAAPPFFPLAIGAPRPEKALAVHFLAGAFGALIGGRQQNTVQRLIGAPGVRFLEAP